MHIYARFSRFRIFAEKKKCISCNVCTSVCHQGIDVMNFANKGLPMEDPQCVRCSACVQTCPTGVLRSGATAKNGLPVLDRLPASPVQMAEQPFGGARMSWYMAMIVRGSFTEHGYDRERMGDMLYKLVEAPDAEAAYEKAVALGEAAVDTYNEEGAEVSLRYLGLADLMELSGLARRRCRGLQPGHQHEALGAGREKEALTVFQPWEILESEEEDLGEITEVGEIAEPGAERFRPPTRED